MLDIPLIIIFSKAVSYLLTMTTSGQRRVPPNVDTFNEEGFRSVEFQKLLYPPEYNVNLKCIEF